MASELEEGRGGEGVWWLREAGCGTNGDRAGPDWWHRSWKRRRAVVGARTKPQELRFTETEGENRRGLRQGRVVEGTGGGLVAPELGDAIGAWGGGGTQREEGMGRGNKKKEKKEKKNLEKMRKKNITILLLIII